jgi:hypothetical protein
MSTYSKLTKNPDGGEWENASWIDDFFGKHNYGVIFPSHPNVVFDPRDQPMETKELAESTERGNIRVEQKSELDEIRRVDEWYKDNNNFNEI